MKKQWMRGMVVACCLVLLTTVARADKVEVEKKAKETKVTLNIKEMPVDKALDMISTMGGVKIKKVDLPKEAPQVTADLKDMPVLDAVKFVTTLTQLNCTITDDGIEVSGNKKN